MKTPRRLLFHVLCISAVLAGSLVCFGQSSGQKPAENDAQTKSAVDFLRDVRPILRTKCATCHNEADPSGSLRLDAAAEMMKGGDSGPAIVPGNSNDSRLIQAVMHVGDLKMPPPDDAKPLEAAQISILRRWIDQGAVVPESDSEVSHWSFQKPVRPVVPVVAVTQSDENSGGSSHAQQKNPVDAFIAQRHQQLQLQALPQAPKHVQLRRLYLDVIGLPPSPEQMQSFLNDDSADAWEKVVDELLASPHYGERWGRHWMDVWRYSDWDGYGAEVRESKPHIWRWRDWIIESLNQDKPYDQMIMEMLAADEVAPDDPQALRATGYLVRNWYVFNRNTWIDNTIEHTGKAFMGVTFNCARCHDHMYDPISQAEYYQLRAFFEPHDIRTDRLPGQSDVTKDGLVRVFDANAGAQTVLFVRGDEKNPLKDKSILPRVPVSLGLSGSLPPGELPIQPVELPAKAYYPGLQDFVASETLNNAEAEMQTSSVAHESALKSAESARSQLVTFQQNTAQSLPAMPFLVDDFSSARPEVWVAGSGSWKYQDGHLVQQDPADTMCSFKTLQPHPADFTARLKFRPTGGDVYKSVGIAFDAGDDQNYSFVYASAGSSKIQVAHRVNGADQYPPAGAKEKAVELSREHELQVTVRGTQLDVALNGEAVLTYSLPNARPAQGRFHIWTYDATAEFIALEITNSTELSEAGLLAAVNQAESEVLLAEQKRVVAAAALDFAKARIAADQANYSTPPGANAKDLSLTAGNAEKQLVARQEELKLLTAEQTLLRAKAALPQDGSPAEESKLKAVTEAEAAVMTAKTAVEAAQKAATEPFETYTRLTTVYPATSSGRRSALARWITSRDNPLTARVAINHLWLRHFHQPLVSTVFDFGINGKPPSHPELLDWLACELMDNGWRMKHLHRLILTSEAYRRASSPTVDQREIFTLNSSADPENRQLWRQNSYRMEAEVVRDATLHVAGQLDPLMYGPDLDPAVGLTLGRRSIYFRTSKEKKMTFLSTFDSPNPVECYQRAESISPQQSLAMSNSPLTLTQSRNIASILSKQLADRSKDDEPGSKENAVDEFVRLAFLRVLNREPNASEIMECSSFLQQQTSRFQSAEPLTAFPGSAPVAATDNVVKPSADAAQRARENLIHVLLNHNDFVTVR
ncbi:MAG: DUF1553 domain-containing protein [Planctomyces sp.]|nr:DUF1553 domain-containing protein [Planctomyces sp.]